MPQIANLQDGQDDLLEVILQAVGEAVVINDAQGRVQAMNAAAENLIGWQAAEAKGKPVSEVIELSEKSTDTLLPNPVFRAMSDNAPVANKTCPILIGRNGRRTPVELAALPVHDLAGSVTGAVLVFRDVSDAVHLAARMSYLTQHDPLTGLPNRILFVDRLEQGIRLADRGTDKVAVIFVSLDRFQEMNDSLGHAVSDELVKEVAFRLLGALRESDTVCRLGGDEFVILVTGVKSIENVEALASKLLADIGTPYELIDQTVETQCSIGISFYPQDAGDVGSLMRLADGAMYQARRMGGNRYIFAKSVVETRTSNG